MTESTAIYSMPGTKQFYRISGQVRSILRPEVFQTPGFIFAPFDASREPIYRIEGQPEAVELLQLPERKWDKNTRVVEGDTWYSYQNMFHAALQSIREGRTEKIVLSLRDIEDHPIDSIPAFLYHLRHAYPDAFVYTFYIPEKELWVGASPELLLDTDWPQQDTVALAGTLKNAPNWEDWPEKERQEHQFVEQYIEEVLQNSKYHKDGPKPVPAGPVYHLNTNYTILSDPKKRADAIDPFQLHPGPALSGYPVPKSIIEILKIEQVPRRYYTGFLGPVWNPGKSRMFINLRCLEMLTSYHVLYAGGGLTIDSDLENEWMEIQYKLSTLRSKIYKGHAIP